MQWTQLVPLNPADWHDLAVSLLIAFGAVVAALAANQVFFWIVERVGRASKNELSQMIPRYHRGPGRLFLPLIFLEVVFPALILPPRIAGVLGHALQLCLIASGTYVLVNTTRLLRDAIIAHVTRDGAHPLHARKIVTQIKLLQRIAIALLLLCGVALMLMTFHGIREVGVSVLASAGLAGIILGLAAQRTLGTLLAGLQIAFTQPIRLGDVVIVEGELGTIEEISLTNVVVKIWDLGRMVLPITYFIEKPFQNWTLSSTEILVSVFFYADFSASVDALRQEARRIAEASELWDGKIYRMQVTDLKNATVELRVVLSAADAQKAWDLRCYLRERLISFIQQNCPESFPRTRAETVRPNGAAGPGTPALDVATRPAERMP
jgi:small-conductance mechanosensitive channel